VHKRNAKKAGSTGVRGGQKPKTLRERKRGPGFGTLAVLLLLAAACMFALTQNQFAVRCDLKVMRLKDNVTAEKFEQERLRLNLARLKSPERVARIAIDELELSEPDGVIYLKYTRDANGELSCQSALEKRDKIASVTPKVKSKKESSGADGPGGTLTRR